MQLAFAFRQFATRNFNHLALRWSQLSLEFDPREIDRHSCNSRFGVNSGWTAALEKVPLDFRDAGAPVGGQLFAASFAGLRPQHTGLRAAVRALGNVLIDIGGGQAETNADRSERVFGVNAGPQCVDEDGAFEHVEIGHGATSRRTEVGDSGNPMFGPCRAMDFDGGALHALPGSAAVRTMFFRRIRFAQKRFVHPDMIIDGDRLGRGRGSEFRPRLAPFREKPISVKLKRWMTAADACTDRYARGPSARDITAKRMNLDQFCQRYKNLQAYLEWNTADVGRIVAMRPLLQPAFAGIVDDFYEAIARNYDVQCVITGGPAQVARLKETLLRWIEQLFQRRYDDEYVRRRLQVGKRHAELRLDQI